jgi:co-chaperonin GroES (HSP10)
MLKPIKDKIVVTLVDKETVSPGGIVLTRADASEANKGIVVAIGGTVVDVAVGDTILPNWNKAQKTSVDGEDFYIVAEEDVVLVFGE